jgi:hypothetical protein
MRLRDARFPKGAAALRQLPAAAALLRVVQLSSERTHEPARQHSSFAEKQECHAELLLVVGGGEPDHVAALLHLPRCGSAESTGSVFARLQSTRGRRRSLWTAVTLAKLARGRRPRSRRLWRAAPGRATD